MLDHWPIGLLPGRLSGWIIRVRTYKLWPANATLGNLAHLGNLLWDRAEPSKVRSLESSWGPYLAVLACSRHDAFMRSWVNSCELADDYYIS